METDSAPFPSTVDAEAYAEHSLEALEAKLAENKQSLAIVKEALALSPNEPVSLTKILTSAL
jgi:hypothetical protein